MGQSVDFELPPQLVGLATQPVHQHFEAALGDDTDHIVLHASAVERADIAGLQLLHAIVHLARQRKIPLDWDNPSDKLRQAADILGMKDYLGLR